MIVATGQEQQKILKDWKDRPLKCFHCNKKHNVKTCPLLSKGERKKVMEANHAKWKVKAVVCQANKQKQQ